MNLGKFFQRVLGIDEIKQQLKGIMKTLDDIRDQVRGEKSLIASVVALIGGLRQQVADALARQGLSADQQAEIDEIFQVASDNGVALTAAVTANTTAIGDPGTGPAPVQTSAPALTVLPEPGNSTVVSDAVGAAARKATTALGDLKDAVAAGGDVSAAATALETAHAELVGVTDADVTDAHDAAKAALDAVVSGSDKPGVAVLTDLTTTHNDLVTAASTPADAAPAEEAPPPEPAAPEQS